MRATPTAPKGKKSYCTKQHFSKSVFSIVKAGCSREEHTTQGQAFPTEGQHNIPLRYLLVIFSSIDFFSMPSSLSIRLSIPFPIIPLFQVYGVPWCSTYLGYSAPQKKGFCSSPAGNPAKAERVVVRSLAQCSWITITRPKGLDFMSFFV